MNSDLGDLYDIMGISVESSNLYASPRLFRTCEYTNEFKNYNTEYNYVYRYDEIGGLNKIINTACCHGLDNHDSHCLVEEERLYAPNTNIVSKVIFKTNTYLDNGLDESEAIMYNDYTSDTIGNITGIAETGKWLKSNDGLVLELVNVNGYSINYQYDELNRLIREENSRLGTFDYIYNSNGYLSEVKKNNTTIKTFNYSNGRLSSLGINKDVSYDNYGNITSFNGNTLEYNDRNLLSKITKADNKVVTYKYNYQGLRYSKIYDNEDTNDTIERIVCYDGDKIISEKLYNVTRQEVKELEYFYNANGVCGIRYDGRNYNFIKDILGNITKIMYHGRVVAEYVYDAWGNHEVVEVSNWSTTDEFVVKNNPFRYRGYYYDIETQLYWVSSRYYSPELCRWISPDSIEYLDPQSINGLNLYAYCGNDPINRYDPTGHSWKSFWNDVGDWFEDHWVELAIGTAFIIGGAVVTALTCGAGTTAWAAFGSALLSSAIQVGAGIGTGVLVNGVSNLIQGNDFFDNVGDTIASSYMLGGILSGGSQMLSGGFRFLRAKTGFKGINSENFGFMSADKLYYDKPGMTVLRLGSRDGAKLAIDFGRYGIHGHILKWSTHIPLIPGIVGISELF